MSQLADHKDALGTLKKIENNPTNYLFIHYSCESFSNISDGRTPRITSIAIRHYYDGQTESFSLHKTAEQMHILPSDIESRYDEIEKCMLDEYFDFIRENKNYYYLHVNMRDINYGFRAIEHRYKVLDGEPYVLEDHQKIDFARLLIRLYGNNYIENPRMESLFRYNGINPLHFLSGPEEAAAFDKHEYVKLHQSTLSKVGIYCDLLDRTIKGQLKTKAKWYDAYGVSPQGIFDYCRDRWWIQILWSILLLVLGAIIGRFI